MNKTILIDDEHAHNLALSYLTLKKYIDHVHLETHKSLHCDGLAVERLLKDSSIFSVLHCTGIK